MSNNRYEYIDFLRGIATIGIIAIHTAFWGGQSYTPEWFWNITLFLDVPFFFYLSGWGSSFHKSDIVKTCKGLGKIWLQYICFISCIALFCHASRWLPHEFAGVLDLRDLVNNYFFNCSIPGFPVVAGSIWFMPVYFSVILINTIIMAVIQKSTRTEEFCFLYMNLLAICFLWISYVPYYLAALNEKQFLFYSFFWMLGYNRVGKTKSVGRLAVALGITACGFCVCSYLLNIPLYDIQSAKFPPTVKYAFASMVVILISKYFEGKLRKCNMLVVHIGRNAIYYYFGQGVGSSLIYYAIDWLDISNWFLKWIITFLINIAVTVALAELIRVTYNTINNIIKSIGISPPRLQQ